MNIEQYETASRGELLEALRQALEREKSALRLAMTDSLTGVGSPRTLEFFSQSLFNRIRRSRNPLIVLYFDLNNFKVYNDQFSHAVGDLVLSSLGAELQAIFRDDDAIVRIGGDEFIVVAELVTAATLNELCRLVSLLASRVHSELSANVQRRLSLQQAGCDYQGHGLGISLVMPSPKRDGHSHLFSGAWGDKGFIPNPEWNNRTFIRCRFSLDEPNTSTESMIDLCRKAADGQMYRSKRGR